MMKKNKCFRLASYLGAISALCFANLSHASDVTLLGGMSLSSGKIGNDSSPDAFKIKSKSFGAFTFGATTTMDLMDSFGIEVGAFYQKRGLSNNISWPGSSDISSFSGDIIHKVSYLTIPILVRYTIFPKYLQVGVGPYAAFALSGVTISNSINTDTQTETLGESNWSVFDWGLAASLRGSYPITSMVDVVGDVRYQMGLNNVHTAKTDNESFKLRDFVFLGGARFNF